MNVLEWPGWAALSGIIAVLAAVVAISIAVIEFRTWTHSSDAAALSLIPEPVRVESGAATLSCNVRAMGPKIFYEARVFVFREGQARPPNSEALAFRQTLTSSDETVRCVVGVPEHELHDHWFAVYWTNFTRWGPRTGASRIRLDSTDRQWIASRAPFVRSRQQPLWRKGRSLS